MQPPKPLFYPGLRRRRSAGQPPRERAQRGMALLEALIAILVFAFGILGLLGLEASAINSAVDSDDRNRAALFASNIASAMWLANSVDQTNANIAPQYAIWQATVNDPTTTGMSNGTLAIKPVTTITNSAGTVIAADITIKWQPPARAVTAAGSLSQLTTRVILP